MNRMEEFETLRQELESPPPALAFTVTRAKARIRRRRTLRVFGLPAASLAGVFTAFVLLVNLSLPFALACANHPVLKELMGAVALSPSLRAMVQNDFIQPVNLTDEDGGASMTIHYLAYDGVQVHLFYTATYNGSDQVEVHPNYALPGGETLEGISYSSGMPPAKGELGHMDLQLYRRELPSDLKLEVELYPRGGGENTPAPSAQDSAAEWFNPDGEARETPVAVLEFDLHFEARFIAAKRTYTPNAQVEIDGQTVVLEKVVVYPTGTQVIFADREGNDAWLKGLELWLEDGRGNEISRRSNGVISSGGAGEFVPDYWLESAYFEPGEELYLCVSQAHWLEKGGQRVTLDLARPERSQTFPWGRLDRVERQGEDVKLIFRLRGVENGLGNLYTTPEGESRYANVWGSETLGEDDDGVPLREEYTYLWDYPWDTVEFALYYTHVTTLEEPLRIPLT